MKILTRVSLALIAIPLAATLWTSPDMILFVQPERAEIAAGTLRSMFSYEGFVHEAGFARFTLAIIGLLILFIPYRKGERWALAALVILIFGYQFPVFFFGSIPNLGTWPIFRNWPEPHASGLAMVGFYSYFFMALSLVGLALAMPRFLRGKRT
jgi:glucan phosphoethanolaminetransferase (alkaline phosphatase superfamily)